MSKTKKYKYDIAISFAEEERDIAALLDTVFRLRKFKRIHAFYYPKFKSELLGEDLDQILPVIYEKQARYALIILSDKYLTKDYCKIELAAIKKRRNVQETRYAFVIQKDNTELTEIGFPRGFVYYPWNYDAEDLADTLLEILGQKSPVPRWIKVLTFMVLVCGVIFAGWRYSKEFHKAEAANLIILKDTLPEVIIEDKGFEPKPKPLNPPPPLFLRDISSSSALDATLYVSGADWSLAQKLSSAVETQLRTQQLTIHRALLNPKVLKGEVFQQLMAGNSGVIEAYHPEEKLDYILTASLGKEEKETEHGLFWRKLTLKLSIFNVKESYRSDYRIFEGQATSGAADHAEGKALEDLLTNIQNELNYEF